MTTTFQRTSDVNWPAPEPVAAERVVGGSPETQSLSLLRSSGVDGWRYEFELPGGGTGVARSTEAFGVERGERASLRWHPTSGVLVAETITPRLESAS